MHLRPEGEPQVGVLQDDTFPTPTEGSDCAQSVISFICPMNQTPNDPVHGAGTYWVLEGAEEHSGSPKTRDVSEADLGCALGPTSVPASRPPGLWAE